jgi:hypothetical protein
LSETLPPSPPDLLNALVTRFTANLDEYRSGRYNEAQLRREFIDPLFGTAGLGWDMHNQRGYAEAYKEVIHEDALKVGASSKAPDYCFRIGGTRKFFLEAKKPSVSIRNEPAPAYQLRRYAWSAKLPLSVLTDFDEFALYDCRARPSPSDGPAAGRVFYCTFDEYAEHWPFIRSVLSRDAVLRGDFDRYAEGTKAKRGTAEVDIAFLREIEGWRETLAKNLAVRNPNLTQPEINFAVQRIIDRIIFLRIGEDRGLEPYGRLRGLAQGHSVYARLCEAFRHADDRYNSGLFHFQREKGRAEIPDYLTLELELDDKVLKDIIDSLYYPESPYEFSVLPTAILGQVYERFLGKAIRLTPGHRAVVEDKPEVKKAGGVYYTPGYIVDYIVANTLGPLLSGATPKGVSRLRILDPACGSGSFLIGAYGHLLDWHRDWYERDGPEQHKKKVFQGPGGGWRLTTGEKKRILLNNIFGVDVDDQAVEVTKLSLLLKVLEGESGGTIDTQLRLFQQRALPDLGLNIKSGNTLIGPEYLKANLFPDEDEIRRVNPFDWEKEFPKVVKGGGFDVVLGNPPYVNAWTLWEALPSVREFINAQGIYETAERHWDLYILFLERALALARPKGYVSFIIPFSYAIQKYGMQSRKLLLERYNVVSIADLRAVRVFGKVPIITIIPVIQKVAAPRAHEISVIRPAGLLSRARVDRFEKTHVVRQEALLQQHEHMLRLDLSPEAERIVEKIRSHSVLLGPLCYVNYGAQMSSRQKGGFGKEHVIRDKKQNRHCKPMISGRELYRYSVRWQGRYVDYSFASDMYGARWPEFFELPKLMIRDITGTHRIESTYDDERYYCDHTVLCALRWSDVATWKQPEQGDDPALSADYDLKYLAGLVGSRCTSYYYNMVLTGEGVRIGGGFHTYPETIRELPVFRLNASSAEHTRAANEIIGRVTRLLDLNRQQQAARTGAEIARLMRQIESADAELDAVVYRLYGMSADEISAIEQWAPAGSTERAETILGEPIETTDSE